MLCGDLFVPKINYEIAVLYPTNEELSQIARDFVSLLKEHLKS
jgi:hypothetical protein